MSKVQPDDHESAIAAIGRASSGILEDPNGVVRIRLFGRELAHSTAYRYALIRGSYKLGQEVISIEWCRWSFETLYWSHTTALLALQGASLQQLLPALLVLRGDPKPPYDPLPGVRGMVVAEIFSAPELAHQQLFALLLPEAGGPTHLPLSSPS